MSAVLGLMGKKQDNSGVWHRVCLNTIVRKGQMLDSERLRILPMGSKVFVKEQRDRRVRIEQPIAGWCSLRSSNGDTILTPLDDTDGVPTTTPLAGEIRTNQANAHQHLDAVAEQEAALKQQLTEQIAASGPGNAKLTEITQELERLQEEVKDAALVSKELEDTQTAVMQSQEELENLKNLQLEKEQMREQLMENINALKAELENEGNAEITELQQRIEEARAEKFKAQSKVEEYDSIAAAAEEEVNALKEEMSQLFYAAPQDFSQSNEVRYRNEDVVMLDGGVGLACVRFWGNVHWDEDGGKYVGVELSDAFGNTDGVVDGTEYFQCQAGYGLFLKVEAVKKKITAEALLHKLQQAVKMQAQEDTKIE